MTAQNVAGEMMIIGFEGQKVTPPLEEWIVKRQIGGVVLFSRNMHSMAQVAELAGDMQKLRSKVSAQPLFVAVDQEGGAVTRFVKGMTALPGNMALGSIQNEDSAYAAGRIIATEMRLMGFNMNFSPVLDLSCRADNAIVGVRSFGQDPALVGRMGVAMIQGLQENGMIAVAKHFPGLGRAHADPHVDLPVVSATDQEMESTDVMPFLRAVHAGVKGIMSAHAVFRAWDDKGLVPATLSRAILHNLLRTKLGFQGMIISDDLEMGAMGKYFELRETARRCVEAGTDVLTVCHDPAKQLEIFHMLQYMAKQGGGPLEQMRASVQRIEDAKKAIAATRPLKDVTITTLGVHKQVAERMGRDSITLVKNDLGLIPLELNKQQRILVLAPHYEGQTQVEEEASDEKEDAAEPLLLKLFREEHAHTDMLRFALEISDADSRLLNAGKDYDVVILFTYNAHLHPGQLSFAGKLLKNKKETVLVALRDPYDLGVLPQAATALATYGFRDCSLRGLVQILFGEVLPKGKMPVRLESQA